MTPAAAPPDESAVRPRAGRYRHLNDPAVVPRHGPHARAVWLAGEGRWRVLLTDSGRDLVAGLFAKYPAPVTLLTKPAPALFGILIRHRNAGEDAAREIDQVAAGAVCLGATYFDDSLTEGTFESFAGWHVRAALGRWLKRHNKHAAAGPLSGSETTPDRPVLSGAVAAILARLSPDERRTLTAAFGLDGQGVPPRTWAGKRKLRAALAAAAREAGVK